LTAPPRYYYGDIAPAFSADGENIAFVRGIVEPVQDIYRVSVKGGEPVRLTSDNVQVNGLSWAPDDRHLIFASSRAGNSSLWRIARTGGAPVWIASAGDDASFQQPSMVQESDRLTYARYSSDTNIWILERSQQPRRLFHTTRWESNSDISPDGERIAFISNQSGHFAVWVCDREGLNPVQLTSMAVSSI
jgi:TolB protein